jgi:hypothetical protein
MFFYLFFQCFVLSCAIYRILPPSPIPESPEIVQEKPSKVRLHFKTELSSWGFFRSWKTSATPRRGRRMKVFSGQEREGSGQQAGALGCHFSLGLDHALEHCIQRQAAQRRMLRKWNICRGLFNQNSGKRARHAGICSRKRLNGFTLSFYGDTPFGNTRISHLGSL